MNLFQIPHGNSILYQLALTEREFAVLKKNVTKDIPDEIRYCAEQSGYLAAKSPTIWYSAAKLRTFCYSATKPRTFCCSPAKSWTFSWYSATKPSPICYSAAKPRTIWCSAAKPRPIWYSAAKPRPIWHSAPDPNTTEIPYSFTRSVLDILIFVLSSSSEHMLWVRG